MTISYFESELPLDDHDITDHKYKPIQLELLTSHFFGDNEIFLKIVDDECKSVRIDKENAKQLLIGLEGAMRYLGYIE